MRASLLEIANSGRTWSALCEVERHAVALWYAGNCFAECDGESAFAALRFVAAHAQDEDAAETLAALCNLSDDVAEALVQRFRADRPMPYIIGIEGLDGSGKTVQAKKLYERLTAAGQRVLMIDFPQYESFFGRQIGAFLSAQDGVSAMDVDAKSMSLWYAADRFKALSAVNFADYDFIVFNRYTLSNVVYQTARTYGGYDEEFPKWILELEHGQLGLPVPDLYLFLDVGTDSCGDNVMKKGHRDYVSGLDVYESSQDLLSCCRRVYHALAQEMPSLQILGCLDDTGHIRSIDDIHEAIVARITEYGIAVD